MDELASLISPHTAWYRHSGPLALEHGQTLSEVTVAYRTWGRLNVAGDNAVLVCHALTGSSDVDRWWPGLLGPGRCLDPSSDFILCANVLGSCYGTTGPRSEAPGTGKRWGAAFPSITVGDMVELQRGLAEHLGIRKFQLVLGGSLGGMQVLEWAVRYPHWVQAIAPMATAVRQPAWALAYSAIQRRLIETDPAWSAGLDATAHDVNHGLAAAREMAMISYRHWQGFNERFGRERHERFGFQTVSYLRYQGEKFAKRFDPVSYVRLIQAMEEFDLAEIHGQSVTELLSPLGVPTLVVSIDSDLLYPPEEQVLLAANLQNAEHVVLRSAHGHDGFLIETTRLDAFVKEFRARVAEELGKGR